jgi:hypothetical protein
MASVIANPCTRVCFRVGDEDARLLAKGFSGFNAEDLQNLGVGEAICRVERAEFDFNLQTPPLPEVDPVQARKSRDRVIGQTRERYGTPRAEVEALFWPKPAHAEPATAAQPAPPPKPDRLAALPDQASSAPPPLAVEIPTRVSKPGRGGPDHQYLQGLIRDQAEALGWGAIIEEQVLDGRGYIDVALRKGMMSIACEIALSCPPKQEIKNIQKCLEARFTLVVELSDNKRHLGAIKALAKNQLSAEEFGRVAFLTPAELMELLPTLDQPADDAVTTIRGFRVRIRGQRFGHPAVADRSKAISEVIAKSLRRARGSKLSPIQ